MFITIGGVVFVLAFSVFMIRGSLPELTPEQIVQMKGYEGQQAPRHIFNLYGLRQYKEAKSLENTNQLVTATPVKVISDGTPVVEAMETVAAISSEPKSRIRLAPLPIAPSEKMPATGAALKPTGKTVRTYEKAELRRQGSIPVFAAVNTSVTEVKKPEVLPVLEVTGDQARLRAGPSRDSDVVMLLSKGDTITVFSAADQWTHVGINDGSSTTGYIHNSLLGEIESN